MGVSQDSHVSRLREGNITYFKFCRNTEHNTKQCIGLT
jgi:hypothetical protein